MKFSELPINTFSDIANDDAYLICNVVEHDDDAVNNVSKSLLHISNFAQKEAINSVIEQNKKFVGLISTLLNKCNEIEGQLKALKSDVDKMSIKSQLPSQDITEVNQKLTELEKRLDENLIEY